MAGTQITTAITQVDEQRKGFQNITLTNWTNLLEPEINQGGRVEISGSLFSFTANEDLDSTNTFAGFGNDTQLYGYYLVAGANVTCILTDVAPTWQEEKGAWYDTGTDTNRFWGGIYKDAGGDYADKFIYDGRELKQANAFQIDERGALTANGTITTVGGIYAVNQYILPKVLEIGNWDMNVSVAGSGIVSVAHGLTHDNIRSVTVLIDIDSGDDSFPLEYWDNARAGGNLSLDEPTSSVVLGVTAGGLFDSNSFNADPFNRGHIVIWYEV